MRQTVALGGVPTFLAASQLMSILGFNVIGDTIVEIFVVADPTRVVAYGTESSGRRYGQTVSTIRSAPAAFG